MEEILKQLLNEMKGLSQQVGSLENKVDRLNSEVSTIKSKVDKLDSEVSAIKSDMGTKTQLDETITSLKLFSTIRKCLMLRLTA